jgi:BMFP domain-containing protein YqiC
MTRRLGGALAALALMLLLATPVLAGGWAQIVADPAATDGDHPVAGEATVVGFMVLQHGVTPAGWEQPTVHLTETATGRTIDVLAHGEGKDGHFAATVTLPSSGFWTWTVTLRDLVAESPAATLAVWTPAGEPPVLDPTSVLAAIDKVRQDVFSQTNATLYTEINRLDQQLQVQRGISDAQGSTIAGLRTERDAMAARLAALEGSGTVPALGILTLAILAGATAGFVMAWLAGRPSPREAALPSGSEPATSPRGSSPV